MRLLRLLFDRRLAFSGCRETLTCKPTIHKCTHKQRGVHFGPWRAREACSSGFVLCFPWESTSLSSHLNTKRRILKAFPFKISFLRSSFNLKTSLECAQKLCARAFQECLISSFLFAFLCHISAQIDRLHFPDYAETD